MAHHRTQPEAYIALSFAAGARWLLTGFLAGGVAGMALMEWIMLR